MPHTLPIAGISLPTPWPPVGPIQVYLIPEDPITLIDTGVYTQESRTALEDGLRAHGLALSDIRRVLLTHVHPDHCGQAAWIQDRSGAEVWMHPDEAGKVETPLWWVQGRDQSLRDAGVPEGVCREMIYNWRKERHLTLPLTDWQPMPDGHRFEFEQGGLSALHLPGHSLGHIAFWEAQGRVLVGGDLLLTGVAPNPTMEALPVDHPAATGPVPYRAPVLAQLQASLARVSGLPVREVFPGHGPVITDHVALAQSYLERHERRLASLLDRIREGSTAFALMREFYPRAQELELFFALSEVMAQLDMLVMRGQAAISHCVVGSIYRAA